MIDNVPGGCGNDFALDDITFRECVKVPPPTTKKVLPPKNNVASGPTKKAQSPVTRPTPRVTQPPLAAAEKKPVTPKTSPTKSLPPVATGPQKKVDPPRSSSAVKRDTPVTRLPADLPKPTVPVLTPRAPRFPAPPPVLTRRSNTLFKQIQTEPGEIVRNLYDNGEIDGDTVTIYHNNVLIVSKARLSQKPVTFRISIDPANPHHELVMVAENLGSIPPNTSLMVVTTGTNRYEVFTSATEERNAKVVFDLKQ